MTATDQHVVKVYTDPTPLGDAYAVCISTGPDQVRYLTPEECHRYADTMLAAAACAEYDAAVIAQMTDVTGIGPIEAYGLVNDLRKDRPPLDQAAIAPLSIEPGVNVRRDGFLTVSLDGERIGQWTCRDAREHALHVLECMAAVDLDAAYARALVGIVGLPRERALMIVGDVRNYRPTRH